NVLPVMIIAEMLGIPPGQYATFKDWSDKIIGAGAAVPGTPIPDEVRDAMEALVDYFKIEVEKRRRNPGSDLVSALVAAHDEAEALNTTELLQFIVLLLLAGNETTTNLIGNGMLALARYPDQMAMLRESPELMPRAIEEMLRFDGPVQSTARFPKAPVEVGGSEIPGGTICFVMVAAANRDPAQFSNPERFDITRDPNDHVAFGEGIHFCIGAPLARLEGSIAIGAVLEKFPNLKLMNPGEKLTYKGSYFLRGLDSLKMAIA
ncbi:MAG TPA: cytochrome P450, partial [Candidatus Binataceae bacterium]